MLRILFMWALICTASPFVCAQINIPDDVNEPDSLDIFLNEVVVVAKNTIAKTDCKVIIPPKSKVNASTSGMDLLQKLALPGISVNQLTGSINITSGGILNLYIDGVPATESQISALAPENILKIEYYDNPGVKYGNADAVLNYITRKKDSGGRLSLESMDCIGDGKFATIDEFAAQFYNGKSSWSVDAGYMQMKRNNWVRDYDEIWHYPDHNVIRSEKGLPVNIGNLMFNSNINYQYSYNESNLFNARLSLNVNEVPNKEEGDRHSLLTTSDNDDITEIWEHTSEKSLQPSLVLHYRHIFEKAGTLSFNFEGSWLKSKSHHTYSEEMAGTKLCDINSNTDGDKYGFYAEGIHEIILGRGMLTSGLRNSQSHTSNHYIFGSQSPVVSTNINQSETSMFAEYIIRVANWGFVGGVTGKRLSSSQLENKLVKYVILPNISVAYKPNSDLFFRYNLNFDRKMPPLASMSNIAQEIQPGLLRRGNPNAKSFSAINQQFSFSYDNKYVKINLSCNYLAESKPVMNSVLYENGIFVQTFENQKYFRKLQSEAMIAVTPLQDHLTLWVAPDFSRYFSRGKNYNLTKNIFRLHFGADATYKHFIFTACTMSGPDNYMYGDEMITEKPMNMILVGYKGTNWALQAGVFNLMKSYWMKTENFSPLTPFTSNAHCGKNTYFAVKISFNLNHGKQQDRHEDLPANVSHFDMDSGIINGVK